MNCLTCELYPKGLIPCFLFCDCSYTLKNIEESVQVQFSPSRVLIFALLCTSQYQVCHAVGVTELKLLLSKLAKLLWFV